MRVWQIETPEALRAFASRLAPFATAIDCIALYGDLGAGKTTFAQGFLAALGVTEPVTSPTYQIVQTYEIGPRTVFHCDFYRIQPSGEEVERLREMSMAGIVIAEWADIMDGFLPGNRLDIHIAGEGHSRDIALSGFGAWAAKLERFKEASAFLAGSNWVDASCTAIRGDASTRTFSRLQSNSGTAMLMDWPLKSDGPPIRNGLAYCEIAHLARDGTSYVALSNWLRTEAGLSAPAVYSEDRKRGYFLIEDLGDGVFGALIAEGRPLEELYRLAVDGLVAIQVQRPQRIIPTAEGRSYELPLFDREALEVELELLPQWYFPWAVEKPCPEKVTLSFFEAWGASLDWLEGQERSLVLRDFHSPNLLLCAERQGGAKLGVVDFQDALWGHPAYDLVSLLQDARLDVPEHAEKNLYARYIESMMRLESAFDAAAFSRAYAILGVQRNTKILGIFARLSMRDGKHDYLKHMPRILGYLLRGLSHPDLSQLRSWYEENLFRMADAAGKDSRSHSGVAR